MGCTLGISASRRRWPVSWSRHTSSVVGFVALVPATLMGLSGFDPTVGVSETWSVCVAMFVALLARWPDRRIPRTRHFWGVAGALVATFVVAGAVIGYPVLSLLWMGCANLACAIIVGRIYKTVASPDTWAIQTPHQLVWFLFASVIGALLMAPLGAVPGTWLATLTPAGEILWTIRTLGHVFIGGITIITLLCWRRDPALPAARAWLVALLFAVGLAGTLLAFVYHNLPISWMFLVPAVWAGMTLTPRQAAWFTLFMAAATAVFGLSPVNQFHYDLYMLSASLMVDLMLAFSSLVIMLLVLFRDARARLVAHVEQQRLAAQAQSDLLNAAFETMNEGVVISDSTGHLIVQNIAARRILKRPWPDELPESWERYFGFEVPKDAANLADEEELFNPGHGVVRTEFMVSGGERGPERLIEASSQAIGRDERARVLLLLTDVTAQRAKFRELSRFAGSVAHDLKGPLAALTGWLEAADDELALDDPVGGRMALLRARRSSERMRRLIDDYLAFAVTREGYLQLGDVCLTEIVEEIRDTAPATEHGPPMFEVDTPHVVSADRTLTRQLLANLIGNSVKYARPGEPAHVVVRSRDAAEPGWVEIEVADRGVGIEPGEEEAIFGVFQRSRKNAESFEGTGLGLALCHAIVSKHGGHIMAERNPHGGATVRFTLPQGRSLTKAETSGPAVDSRPHALSHPGANPVIA